MGIGFGAGYELETMYNKITGRNGGLPPDSLRKAIKDHNDVTAEAVAENSLENDNKSPQKNNEGPSLG